MKKILLALLVVIGCSDDAPTPISGTWNFSTDQFSGRITIDSEGVGTGLFSINGTEYSAINTQILEGSSIVMYSEDGGYIGLHQVDFPTSKYQEYREPSPTPFVTNKRQSHLTLTKTQ